MGDNAGRVIAPGQVVQPQAAVDDLEAEAAVLEGAFVIVAVLVLARRNLVHQILGSRKDIKAAGQDTD